MTASATRSVEAAPSETQAAAPGPGSPQSAGTPRTARDPTFDILKGLSILEVMTHHLLATAVRKFTEPQDVMWWVMVTLSRVLHFAVPTFLLVSAVLLARSVASKPRPDWRRFFARRAQRTLWPYLLWTGGYIAFRAFWMRAESDVMPAQLSLPLAGTVSLPTVLTPSGLWTIYFWGKAYYHIYFMVILLQFSVLFPFLLAVMRRLRIGVGGAVALGAIVQVLAFYGQRHLFSVPYPASTVFWYCLPVIVGMWIGLHWKEWDGVWRRWRWAIAGATVGGLALYLPLALMIYVGRPASSDLYHLGIKTYCIGIALLLLALSKTLSRVRYAGAFLQRVGDRSIALFLIHPMILYLLSGPRITAFLERTFAPTLLLGLLMFAITWSLSEASRKLKADGFLFGR